MTLTLEAQWKDGRMKDWVLISPPSPPGMFSTTWNIHEPMISGEQHLQEANPGIRNDE